ncbi:DUF3617 domain-containing protein [Dyella subtropica]|uniref:DUF3617 domain-containing protein n=1 Tax=Dyella subtropica TaxID=2992127 RepID=UPI0022537083|nr:DUF3617 family protein [Dyella subtropica]
MTSPIVHQRWFRHPLLYLSAGLVVAMAATAVHADAGDFQAMPGLWKIVTHVVRQGHPGAEQVAWHCVDEDADPWAEFAALPLPGIEACQRGDEQRSRTSLAWTLNCPGHPSMPARGRVAFDSPEHYTGSLAAHDGSDLLRVEGQRYAACTSPKD